MLEDGDLTVGHAKALMAFDDEGLMTEAAEKACGGRLTVRELEKWRRTGINQIKIKRMKE